jgi:hypothetical protein
MDTLFKEILQESLDKKKIIGIRIYDKGDSIYVGYVLDYNDEIILIRHFTEYGRNDGVVLESIERIENIEVDDDYYESLQYLVQITNELDNTNIEDYKFELTGNWQFENLKKFLGKEIVIIIENSKSEKICGFVDRVTKDELIFNVIGKLGQNEGLSLYKLKDISSIQPDDLECRKRLCLYKWKKNKNK